MVDHEAEYDLKNYGNRGGCSVAHACLSASSGCRGMFTLTRK